LVHPPLDRGALRRIGRRDLEVVVELRAIRRDRERASFHHREARDDGRELHDRIVRSPAMA
jgi:hypothetical protein